MLTRETKMVNIVNILSAKHHSVDIIYILHFQNYLKDARMTK